METRARYILVGLFALVAIAAGFAFVYWLNNTSGLGKRDVYQIRFLGAVSGLQIGAAVQYNGIRVGEVTGLALNHDNPGEVNATIAIERGTPLRSDTKVSVDFQGLMGSPLISLKGGTLASPILVGSQGSPPTLVADASAGEDLTQTARGTLQQVDKILADNKQSLKETIDNLKTFSGALARNSNRVDGIMAGLEHMAGGGPAEKPKPVYDLTMSIPASAALHGQLAIVEPTSRRRPRYAADAFAVERRPDIPDRRCAMERLTAETYSGEDCAKPGKCRAERDIGGCSGRARYGQSASDRSPKFLDNRWRLAERRRCVCRQNHRG